MSLQGDMSEKDIAHRQSRTPAYTVRDLGLFHSHFKNVENVGGKEVNTQ